MAMSAAIPPGPRTSRDSDPVAENRTLRLDLEGGKAPGQALSCNAPKIGMETAFRMKSPLGSSGPAAARRGKLAFDLAFLTLLVLALVRAGLEWVPANLLPPQMDDAVHLAGFLAVQAQMAEARSLEAFLAPWLFWFDHHGVYPPLAFQVMGQLGAWSGGLDVCGMACLNLFWLALAGLGVYILALRLFREEPGGHGLGGRPVGVVAALLVTFSPLLQSYLTTFFLDLPALATLTLALAGLASFLCLRTPLVACLAGAAVAAAALTKWTVLFGLFPGVLFTVFRAFRGSLPRERVILGHTLILGLASLVAAGILATRISPLITMPTEVFSPPQVLGLVAVLGIGCALVLAFSLPRLGSALPRGLVLASCSGILLAGPFYLTRLAPLAIRLFNDLEGSPLRRQLTLLDPLHEVLKLPVAGALSSPGALTVVVALIWLAWRGSPEIRFLLVAPVLSFLVALLVLALEGGRYYLPLHALGMLALSGMAWRIRLFRVLLFPLLIWLGFWNAGLWDTARALGERPVAFETRALVPGCGPESLNGRLARLLDQVAEASGPGIRAFGVYSGEATGWNSPETLQSVAMSQGHALIVRKFDPINQGGFNAGRNQASRFAALKVPRASVQDLWTESASPFLALPGRWLLVLEPEEEPLRIPSHQKARLGPPRLLSAPPGYRARLHPVLPLEEGAAG